MVYVSVIVIVCDDSLVQCNDAEWIFETFERVYLIFKNYSNLLMNKNYASIIQRYGNVRNQKEIS
jgi:hypothetical protein